MSKRISTANAPPVPETVERLSGRGTISRGGVAVGETTYDLTVTPPHLRGAASFEPGNEPKVTPDITGRLMDALFGAEPFADGVHTLTLEDGRMFDFRVIQPDTNEIIGVSWFRSS